MEFDDYQETTAETAIYPDEFPEWVDTEIVYLVLGIAGEAGEVADKAKKAIREDEPEYLEDLPDETGDLLWYIARLLAEMDNDMSDVAEENLEKLLDRQVRDVLEGEGDDR